MVDAIATDHAPHPPEAKDLPLAEAPSGMLGLETALAVALGALVDGEPRLDAECVQSPGSSISPDGVERRAPADVLGPGSDMRARGRPGGRPGRADRGGVARESVCDRPSSHLDRRCEPALFQEPQHAVRGDGRSRARCATPCSSASPSSSTGRRNGDGVDEPSCRSVARRTSS